MAYATYDSGDVRIVYSADLHLNDYGVPGSPTWYEPDGINVVSVEIFGVEVEMGKLPLDLQSTIMDLADEVEFE